MANKKGTNKRNRLRGRRTGAGAKIALLLALILIEVGIIAGSVWYYLSFQPRAQEEVVATAANFAKEFFTVEHTAITGEEARGLMTASHAEQVLASGRVEAWKEQELAIAVKGDVEVRILEQKLRTAVIRVIFWQQEEAKEQEGKEYLIYYDLDLVRTQGRWLVDNIHVANPEELATLRRNKGVWEEHYGETE